MKMFLALIVAALFVTTGYAADIDGDVGTRYMLVYIGDSAGTPNPLPANADSVGAIAIGKPTNLGVLALGNTNQSGWCRTALSGTAYADDTRYTVSQSYQQKYGNFMDIDLHGRVAQAQFHQNVKSGESEISNGPFAERWELLDTSPCVDADGKYYMKYAWHPDAA